MKAIRKQIAAIGIAAAILSNTWGANNPLSRAAFGSITALAIIALMVSPCG